MADNGTQIAFNAQSDSVKTEHKSYAEHAKLREVFDAVKGGTDSIRKGGEQWLPKYPAESSGDYKARLCTATIDGIVQGGVDVIAGAVFYDEIDTDGVNANIKPLLENIDNQGNSFNVFCRDAFRESFDGFSVIVVDAPSPVSPVRSQEDEQRAGLRPYWRLYKAADVWNWDFETDPVSKQKRLRMIVFKEKVSERSGRFLSRDAVYYRHWFVEDNQARWELWQERDDLKDQVVLIGSGVIGKLTELPVAFIGDVNDEPKLLVESRLEIKAYQKESSFDMIEYLSVPTFYTKGYDGEERIAIGGSAHVKMPVDGDVGYAQIDSSGLESLKATIAAIKETIRGRVNEMVSVTVEGAVEETATAAMIKDRDKQARIVVWADELKDAIERALQFTGQFLNLGDDGAGEIVLRTKWQTMAEQAAAMNRIETDDDEKDTDKGKSGRD